VVQTTILVVMMASVLAANLVGLFSGLLFRQSILFCGVIGVMTALGWLYVHLRRGEGAQLAVVALLYLDSVVGLFFFYIAGEFETPAVALVGICLVMAPLYTTRRHTWIIAGLQWSLYLALVFNRQFGLIPESLLPYGYMLPREDVLEPKFIADCVIGFTGLIVGLALLGGRASLDIVSSQKQLQEEVDRKTKEIAQANEAISEVNEQLARTNEELSRRNQFLKQFNAAISHDLRAPLQTITLRAEYAQMVGQSRSVPIQEACTEIVNTALRMSNLIDELLKFAKVSEEGLHTALVSVGEVVELVRAELQPSMVRRRARMEVVHPLPEVQANPALLHTILQNLLENGIKYGSPSGARVRIEPVPGEHGLVGFAVEDDGAGVPESERQRIFGLFKRMEQHAGVDGAGAGLAIVKHIVDVHGGTISVEAGRTLPGARFVVMLPPAGQVPALVLVGGGAQGQVRPSPAPALKDHRPAAGL
jgi:signal transduction histidine kinase